eukprot:3294838-Pyramimonas_sp.AAC.1
MPIYMRWEGLGGKRAGTGGAAEEKRGWPPPAGARALPPPAAASPAQAPLAAKPRPFAASAGSARSPQPSAPSALSGPPQGRQPERH